MTERAEVGARTPGPWVLDDEDTVVTAERGLIASVYDGTQWPDTDPKTAEANAAFIVKACNENADLHATVAALRKALEDVIALRRSAHVKVLREGEQPNPSSVALTKAVDIARAALALRDPAGKET